MASGDTLFDLHPLGISPPSANPATLDYIADASTPNIHIPVLDFDGATDEHAEWRVQVPSHYDGGGFTFSYKYATDGSDADLVELEFRVIKLVDATDVLTADLGLDTQTAVAIQDTPPATPTNKFSVSTTGNLSHANADSPSAGDYLVIRATRDISAATNTDDLQLLSVLVTET